MIDIDETGDTLLVTNGSRVVVVHPWAAAREFDLGTGFHFMFSEMENGRVAVFRQTAESYSSPAEVTIHDVSDMRETARLRLPDGICMPQSMALSPSGSSLIVTNHEEQLLVANLGSGNWMRCEELYSSSITGCGFGRDERNLWACFSDQGGGEMAVLSRSESKLAYARSLELAAGQLSPTLANAVSATAISPDGALLLVYVAYPLMTSDTGPYASLSAYDAKTYQRVWAKEIAASSQPRLVDGETYVTSTCIRFLNTDLVMVGSFDRVLAFDLVDGSDAGTISLQVVGFIHSFACSWLDNNVYFQTRSAPNTSVERFDIPR